jgi:hypothetical protein
MNPIGLTRPLCYTAPVRLQVHTRNLGYKGEEKNLCHRRESNCNSPVIKPVV